MRQATENDIEVLKGVYLIKEVYWKFIQINAFLVTNCGEAALIDTGIKMMGRKIVEQLSSKKDLQLKYIIITHAHNDHLGSVRMLKEKTKAKVVCHLLDVPWLEDADLQFKETSCRFTHQTKEKRESFDEVVGGSVKCDVILRDKDTLEVGDLKLVIVHSPGHTPGSISIYIPKLRALFTGDTLQWTHDFLKTGHLGFVTDASSYYNTLRKLQQINALHILPGHYSMINERKKIRETFSLCFEHYGKYEEELLSILRGRRLSLKEIKDEIVSRMKARTDEDAELWMTYAFLNKLTQEGKISKKEEWYIST